LKNFVERAYILADHVLEGIPTAPADPAAAGAGPSTVSVPVGVSLAEADKKLILATLEHCGGVKKWAAELLGISLKTLYNRLEEYRIASRGMSAVAEREAARAAGSPEATKRGEPPPRRPHGHRPPPAS